MKRQKYYPSRTGDQIPWLENFRTKLPGYVATLGLDPAKSGAAVASARFIVYLLNEWLAAVRAFSPAATEAVEHSLTGTGSGPVELTTFTTPPLPQNVAPLPPGALNRIFELVAKIKEADAYTEAMGHDLGIIGAESAATIRPQKSNSSSALARERNQLS